jgi:hypothetical protein
LKASLPLPNPAQKKTQKRVAVASVMTKEATSPEALLVPWKLSKNTKSSTLTLFN